MRIGIDARMARDWETGVGRIGVEVTRRLLVRHPEHTYVLLRDPRAPPLGCVEGGGPLEDRPVDCPARSPQQHALFPRLARGLALDVVLHTHQLATPIWSGRPAVGMVLDVYPLALPGMFPRRMALYYRTVVGLAERTKRRVIAISEASRRDAVRYLGLRPGRVTAIPLAAGAAFRPAEDRGAPRARLAARGFPDRYLLYIGNTRPHKNVRRLLRAYAALVREGVEMPPLVLGGLDDMRQDAGVAWPARAAAELGIQGRVRLTGVMTDAELADAYRGALALAIPSIYEGFGLEALEAMACGTPVLAGRGGALVEVVGDAGLLVEPRETAAIAAGLRRLVEDAALREQLAAAGVARAATFSWERTADAILGVLLEAAR